MKLDKTKFEMCIENNLRDRGEVTVGEALAKQVKSKKYDDHLRNFL